MTITAIFESKKIYMKNIVLIVIAGLMIGCGDATPKSDTQKDASVGTAMAVEMPIELSNGTPVYNYDQLSQIINKEDGKTYVINFWATWCKPCVEELPYFEQLNETYKDDQVEVILVSLDFKKQFEKKLVPFMTDRKLKSKVMVLLDPDSNTWIDKVSDEWTGAIPATIIRNGTKSEFREGSYATFDELNNIVKTYL